MTLLDEPESLIVNENLPEISLMDAVEALQSESATNGLSEMTMVEIDAEIAAYRHEKQGL